MCDVLSVAILALLLLSMTVLERKLLHFEIYNEMKDRWRERENYY